VRPVPRRVLSALLLATTLLAACGSEDGLAPEGGPTAPGDPSGPPPPPGAYEAERQACVAHVNALRATVGLPPLARWTGNEACADGQARSDSETGVAHGAFGSCPGWAQNECPGWRALTGGNGIVPGCLDMMWAEGPGGGHYDNMTRAGYTQIACGFHTTPQGRVWAVQDFR
jgi:hypothetical protein